MKVLIINGHPNRESFSYALAESYRSGAESSGATIDQINLADLDFDLNLAHGYSKRTELEPDLLKAQEKLKWADHLVWVYPVWWGSYPALMKGFIDRVLLPGFAFKKIEGSIKWEKYLEGKSARLISTLDQPPWYYHLVFHAPSTRALRGATMKFIGVKKVRSIEFGIVRLSDEKKRQKWLEKVRKLGEKLK